jgi:hypothetical protein
MSYQTMVRVFAGRYKRIGAFGDPQDTALRFADGRCVLHEQFAPQPEDLREARRRM